VYIAKQKGILNDYYDQREELIDYYHDLSRRIAKMRLRGEASWTKEDYELAYGIRSGMIMLPSGELWDPSAYKMGIDSNNERIKRGLFNVRRWITGVDGRDMRRTQDPFPSLPTVDSNTFRTRTPLGGADYIRDMAARAGDAFRNQPQAGSGWGSAFASATGTGTV
jgi:hypothetical protein